MMNVRNELNEKMLENVTGGCGLDGINAGRIRRRKEEAASGGYGGASEKISDEPIDGCGSVTEQF